MVHTNPIFSIIVPCYNRVSYLPGLVEIMQRQSFPDWEMILMDDGSTDETAAVIQSYLGDHRIKYFQQSNAGVSVARNAAVEKASGEYLLFLDSDDKLHEPTLQVLATAIEETHADVLFCSCRLIKDGVEKIKVPADLGKIFAHVKGLFLAGAFCVRKATFTAVGGYSAGLKFSENFELGMRICQLPVKTTVVDHIAADYFIYSQKRTSNSLENKLNSNLFILKKHAHLLKNDASYFSTILSQTGYLYQALGKGREARSYYRMSFYARPLNGTNLYRFLTSFF